MNFKICFSIKSLHRQTFLHTFIIYSSSYNIIYENDRIEVAAKIKRPTFRNFLRLMMESLSVIHYYRAKYSHMTGICAIHFRLNTMTEIRSKGNPKFLSTAKCIFYDWWKTVPNKTRASKHQLVTYIIMLFHANFFMIKPISNENT